MNDEIHIATQSKAFNPQNDGTMELKVISGFDEEDYRSRLKINLGEITLLFCDWETEDNNLWINFSDCHYIQKMVMEANRLWLEGTSITLTEIEDNNIFSDNYE